MPDPGASHAHTRLGRFALIATTLLWGSSFTIMKEGWWPVPSAGIQKVYSREAPSGAAVSLPSSTV